jgi:zinc protease
LELRRCTKDDVVTARNTISPLITHTLNNGLTIYLREKHDAPLTSFWTWYRVGSRDELPGKTGLSHWVEHMQFKGTPTLEKGAIFRDVSRFGGSLNAMTSSDWTAYYETLPSNQVDLSLRIESDRMVNSLYDPEETGNERTVILSERQGAENRPMFHLTEEVGGIAFQAHPYRHMVIGYEGDLKRISRDDLYNHYKRYYVPNNAFISAVGDFDADQMLSQIEDAFGDIPAGPPNSGEVAPEPPQRGERRVTIRKPSPAAYMLMGYRFPDARHADIPALLVADAILSGAKAMGMGGGGGMGRSSRLYKSLVSTGLARSAGSNAGLSKDPELWTFTATALPGVEQQQIEQAFEAEFDRLKTDLASDEEFAKARKQIRAQYVYSNETVTSQAFWLGQMEIVDHAARVDTLAEELAAVTPEDVRRVAQTWLINSQRTVGWQLPEDGPVEAGGDAIDTRPMKYWGLSGPVVSAHGFVRTELPSGIVVLAQPRPGDASVSATISIEAGHAATGETRSGLAALTGRMLNRGTDQRSFDAFNDAIDGLGAMIETGIDSRSIEVSLHSLSEDLDAVLALAAEIITQPTFPADELEKVRQQTITGIRERDNDTRSMASRALNELLYPEGHPLRIQTGGTVESVSDISRQDLIDYHARSIGSNVTTIALAGGVRDLDEAVRRIELAFAGWKTTVAQPHEPTPVAPGAAERRDVRVVPGKSQADVAIGYPTIPRSHSDYYALNVANVILGQLGLMGRLGANVRDKQGLAYYAYSRIGSGKASSVWHASAGVDPGNIDRAIDGIRDELRRLRTDGVTVEELADAKSYLTGSTPLAIESLGGVVGLLLSIEQYELGLDYLERYPGIINALTQDQLLAAVQAHLDPDRLAIGVAGPAIISPES